MRTDSKKIQLPALKLTPVAYEIGRAYHVLREPETRSVIEVEDIPVSKRTRAECLTLDNGERIVTTERPRLTVPSDVDGVLHVGPEGSKWLNHRLVEQADTTAAQTGLRTVADRVGDTWNDAFRFKAADETTNTYVPRGLRAPQLGALFAIGAHWSLQATPATIVMPTGTGKTEAMLSAIVAYKLRRVLIVVPSAALRNQTASKALVLGLLRSLGVLSIDALNPVVGVVLRRPTRSDDLRLLSDCNIVVATSSAIASGTAASFTSQAGNTMSTLIIDEAHHVAAATWSRLREAFSQKKIMQFTATPFRNDGKVVDGKVVYSYPLSDAQSDGFFSGITLRPIYEIDDTLSDELIADASIEQLRKDLSEGYDHILMARCKSKARADAVFSLYRDRAPDMSPLLIYTGLPDNNSKLRRLRQHRSRIVVCVDMLGEGVDIPALKVAAIHDSHQSLAVFLQFVGRFTRTSEHAIGGATVIANLANDQVSTALERLYEQDADWNTLLHELSSSAARDHARMVEFLANSHLHVPNDEEFAGESVSPQSLRPVFSTLFFRANAFWPSRFHEGLPKGLSVAKFWINQESNTLFLVTFRKDRVRWSRSKAIADNRWDLFVIHFDRQKRLIYLSSSDKTSHFSELAAAVGAEAQVTGEEMFRSLGNIGRLVFNNLGVTKHGRRNLSFAMYTGANIKEALGETETHGSRKSNISGYGWADGQQITIGCSHKGRVWSKRAGSIPQFIEWAESVGAKLTDPNIDTKAIIRNVLIPEWANAIPDYEVLSVDWPVEILRMAEDRVSVRQGQVDVGLHNLEFRVCGISTDRKSISLALVSIGGLTEAQFELHVGGEDGFEVTQHRGPELSIHIGSRGYALLDYLNDYPPLVRFVDLSELDGNILLRAGSSGVVQFDSTYLTPWSWAGTDITKESIWRQRQQRTDSIQWRVARQYIEEGFSFVFDDDGAGEAADLVCFKEDCSTISLHLVHCKYSSGDTVGARVKDVAEVASQAVRSARRPGEFLNLIAHLRGRQRDRIRGGGPTRIVNGTISDLSRLEKLYRQKEVKAAIRVVQPGLSQQRMSDNQSVVLGAAAAYIKQTLGIEMEVICSE